MARFKIAHDYNHRQFHFLQGDVVELSAEDVELLHHGASSLLEPVSDDAVLVDADDAALDTEYPVGDDANRSVDAPPSDRMQRGKKKRRHADRESDPEANSAGAITRSNFGAVKG